MITDQHFASLRQRARLLMLLSSLERVGMAPVPMTRLHGFAYLADVLSPVWGFVPYDGAILKIREGPHYTELQKELDGLVVLGLVDILELSYRMTGSQGARIDGCYRLRFESEHLGRILDQLGATPGVDPLDPRDVKRNTFLVELAAALSTIPDDEISKAAQCDATYADESLSFSNIIELDRRYDKGIVNKSVTVTSRFEHFLPAEESFTPGQKVYLYASYLGKKIHA